MVRNILILTVTGIMLLATAACPVTAQQTPVFASSFCISPQLGTDLGGAVPIPFNAVGGYFNAYPKLNATLGARFFLNLHPRWSVGANLNYKTIAMDADARVTNQKFKGENTVQYFTGTSEMSMSFTLLEIPLYAEFLLGSKKQHGIQLGSFRFLCIQIAFRHPCHQGVHWIRTGPGGFRSDQSPGHGFFIITRHLGCRFVFWV